MKKVLIVDIDGTLSIISPERIKALKANPPDWDIIYKEPFDDKPHYDMVELVNVLSATYNIVFCTGRKECIRKQTLEWLRDNLDFSIDSTQLLMRSNGDTRHDLVVKPELVLKNIKRDCIFAILEDRDFVVEEWRQLGFRCLQVAKGDF